MKIGVVIACITLISMLMVTGCKGDNYVPGKGVVEAFQAKYPAAKRVEWEMKGTYQVAEFRVNNVEMEAWFDGKGTWMMTESDVSFNALPGEIRGRFKAGEYGKWMIEDMDKLERPGMEVLYVIEVEQGEQEMDLHYLEDGTLVRTVMDKENKAYVPGVMAPVVVAFVQQKYPRAKIVEIDEERGMLEVDVLDDGRVKELTFQSSNAWVKTAWEVRQGDVPTKVMAVLKSSAYGSYRVDDVAYEERADGTNVYVFEVERGNEEVYVTVNAASLTIVATRVKK